MENHQNTDKPQHSKGGGLPAFFNVGSAVKMCCVGFCAGVVLRVVQMLFGYDYQTGFYTDSGLLSWLSLIVNVVLGLLGGCMCYASRQYFGGYVARPSAPLGGAALFSGAVLIASGTLQAVDYLRYLRTGISSYDSAKRGVIHVAFFTLCFLFGVVQLIAGAAFLKGKELFRRAPLLYLFAVFWGVAYMILVYVFYARSSLFIENFFAVIGAAATLLALFYLCKLLAGVEASSAAVRLFITGLFSVMLTVTYSVSNLFLYLLGRSYVGEIPPMVQLASLGVGIFLLVFLMTFRRDSAEQ